MGRREDELRLHEIGGAIAGWALGLGLLRVHLAAFTVGAVALVIADLYRSPAELGAGGSLRLWAIVLACHAAALFAGWATWRAVRPDRLPNSGRLTLTTNMAPPVVTRAPISADWAANGHAPIATPGPVSAPVNGFAHQPVTPSVPASTPPNGVAPQTIPLPARGRFSPPTSEPTVVGRGVVPHLHASEATAKLRAGAAGAVAAGRTGWQRFAGATRSSAATIKERLKQPGAKHDATGQMPPHQAPASPPGWPAPPVATEAPPGWEQVVTPASQADELTASQTPAGAEGWPAPPAGQHEASPAPVSTPASRPSEPPLKSETEWTWMAAAAASWLARRDAEAGQGGSAAAPPAGVPADSHPAGDGGEPTARS